MKKKILSTFLALALLLSAVLSLGSCGLIKKIFGKNEPDDIYTIANSSAATALTTKVGYKAPNGEDFGGWYVAKREGNNMIVEYEYDRYQTIEESVESGNSDRKVKEAGTVYYLDGKYYDSGDATKTPWVGSPLDVNFKFSLDKSKLSNIVTPEANLLYATMTPEACAEMFGITINCEGAISLYIATNGVQLTEMQMVYTTDSGASVTVFTTYSYNDLALDFTPITGEPETEPEAE